MTKRGAPEDLFIAFADEVPPLFFRLRGLAERVHAALGVSAAQRAVLRDLVEQGPLTAPQLAAMRSVTRQAVQPVIDELTGRGLARLQPNPRHMRSSLVAVTAEGRAAHQAMRAAERESLEFAAKEFTAAELTAALEAVRQVSKVLRQHFPETLP